MWSFEGCDALVSQKTGRRRVLTHVVPCSFCLALVDMKERVCGAGSSPQTPISWSAGEPDWGFKASVSPTLQQRRRPWPGTLLLNDPRHCEEARNKTLHVLKRGLGAVFYMQSYILYVELNWQEIRPWNEPEFILMKERGVTDLKMKALNKPSKRSQLLFWLAISFLKDYYNVSFSLTVKM